MGLADGVLLLQAVVDPRFVSQKVKDVLKQDPHV